MTTARHIGCGLAWLLLAALVPGARPESAPARQITDAAGRQVTLPARVTRIADPWHANNAMVLLLGGGDKIVATTAQARRQPWLQRLFPRITQVPAAFDAAGDANLESLIGARPDVILMAWDGGGLPKWADVATANHIPFVLMPNTSLAALATTARMTGEVLGPEEAKVAAEFDRVLESNIRRVRERTDRLAPSARPKVLHTASAGVLVVDGRDTLIDDWIRIAGGTNAADVAGLGRPVTLEQVVAWNPDVIIVGSAPNPRNREAILKDSRWRQIEAVKRGRVIANPSGAYLWDRHSPEAALQVLWAAKVLHPELFADVDLGRETREFYAKFFHYTLSDRELESILASMPPPAP